MNWVLPMVGPVIGGMLAIVISSTLTQRRERQAEWRALRFAQYREFGLAVAAFAYNRSISPETRKQAEERYSDAYTSVMLIAPKEVVAAIRSYQEVMGAHNYDRASPEERERVRDAMFRAIRRDIHPSMKAGEDELTFPLTGLSAPREPDPSAAPKREGD